MKWNIMKLTKMPEEQSEHLNANVVDRVNKIPIDTMMRIQIAFVWATLLKRRFHSKR